MFATGFFLPSAVSDLRATLAETWSAAGTYSITPAATINLLAAIETLIIAFLAPLLLVLVGLSLAASMAQNAPKLSGDSLKPQLSRISLAGGLSRIFGPKGLAEFGKSLFKVSVVAITALILFQVLGDVTLSALLTDPRQLPGLLLHASLLLLVGISIPVAALAALDLVLVRRFWMDDLKMSRQEIKDEMKQSEGDPLLKSRLRSLQQDRSRHRMLAQISTATVVITNPTHLAVALRYRDGIDLAPIVVGKGADLVALRIREVADKNEIKIVENRPLARSLYNTVAVDSAIPADLYSAVAEVLIAIRRTDARNRTILAPRSIE